MHAGGALATKRPLFHIVDDVIVTDLGKAYINESCSNNMVSAECKLARNITRKTQQYSEIWTNQSMNSGHCPNKDIPTISEHDYTLV